MFWQCLRLIAFLFFSATLFPSGSAQAQTGKGTQIRYHNLKAGRYLYLQDIARYYGMKYRASGKEARLTSRFSQLIFTQDSRLFKLNGIEANLSFPAVKNKNEFLVSQSDFQYFIDPILRRNTVPNRKIRHILLDAGHGGNDPGTKNGGVVEKNMNLLMTRRVAAILRKRGYKVTTTRERDVFLSLEQRAALTRKLKPDLFLSIHCNAAPDTAVHGIETFVNNPAHTPSSGGNVVAKKTAPGNAYNLENALLGFILQQKLLSATKAHDRGIKRKQFYVIREAPCPSALLELGFLSNSAERKKMLESRYQDTLAVAICDAVQEFSERQ